MKQWPGPEVPRLPGKGLDVRLHDTVSGELRPTTTGPTATMYVCGITPYDATHIGHAATYVAFDLLQRAWRDAGHSVTYVQNVTDVDDPLLERATATGVDWRDLAARETALYGEDMTALGVIPPDVYLGATETVPLVVDAVTRLLDAGAAYRVGDERDVYFDVSSDPRFGGVANLDPEQMTALFGERGGDPERDGKRHPLDALMWRTEREGEPCWDGGPLGPGRPGWHIECVAIARTYLPQPFDVQGGGSDLAFPHHEMGASHAHVLAGRAPYARTYAHAGMVGLHGAKMSKSKGNLVLVSRLRAGGVDPMAIRLALLEHHYRDDWDWTDQSMAAAGSRLERWRDAVSRNGGPDATATLTRVRERLADDLDAPAALTAIDRWAHEQVTRGGDDEGAPGVISRAASALLGVRL
ncbi:MAG TPA: cysteine--1-D-myo-inosityl 2-amino-2-deoxy-alpha-D-glucopyranoside ligase [Actinomycetales bacterium]|nr:cysteine--1-D-myo-inosityl 2-amino-2-deoxy-alpha-D-glucopyranoside ligase [Actinomycetales bacterium]